MSNVYGQIQMLYPDEDTYTLHDIVVIGVGDIVNVSHAIPKNIQKISNHMFIALDYQVSYIMF